MKPVVWVCSTWAFCYTVWPFFGSAITNTLQLSCENSWNSSSNVTIAGVSALRESTRANDLTDSCDRRMTTKWCGYHTRKAPTRLLNGLNHDSINCVRQDGIKLSNFKGSVSTVKSSAKNCNTLIFKVLRLHLCCRNKPSKYYSCSALDVVIKGCGLFLITIK